MNDYEYIRLKAAATMEVERRKDPQPLGFENSHRKSLRENSVS